MAKFRKPFRFPLSVEKRAAAADRLSMIEGRHEQLEAEKKLVTATLGEALKGLRAESRALSRSVRQGEEERLVECEVRKHPTAPRMQLVRLDTGEVFDERAMTPEESQVSFGEKWEKFLEAVAKGINEPTHAPGDKELPACPAPEPANPDGLCGASGDAANEGLCKWHVDKYPDQRARAKLKADADKARAEAQAKLDAKVAESGSKPEPEAPPATPKGAKPKPPKGPKGGNGGKGKSSKPKGKQEAEDAASDVQRCTGCKQFPCTCEKRAGDEPH